jgi:tetratricopeptide (TPR) repeat protein
MSNNANEHNASLINNLLNLSTSNDLDIKSVSLAYLDLLSEYENTLSSYIIDILSKSGKDQNKIRARWSTALAYRAQYLSNQKSFSESLKLYNKSLTIWPNNNKARKGLASIYLLTDDFSNAVVTYGEIVKINKSDWNGWAGLANAQARNGQLDIALEAYIKSLEINTYNASAHLGIGDIFYKKKNYILAEKHLLKAIELDTAILEAYIFLAAVKVKQKDYKNASLYLNRGLIINPDHEIGNMMKRELTTIK